ncbi:UvrD-helicase domain-containing protein [Mesorhizobium sp. M1227]|uniref:UvrD-helicase domain-containing protein n=1 Tax=Mesorhizobium sp. M1227 TaxID=2957071 RepID=UPI003334D406
MKRPYLSLSVSEIEAIANKALAAGNTPTLRAVASELRDHRNTPSAKKLLARIQQLQASKQPDLFEAMKPAARTSRKPKAIGGHERVPLKAGSRTPTAEQEQAIQAFLSGGSLRINAYAGTGKTSTLQFLAQSTRRRGQYVAFNKAIVTDSKGKFPATVDCATTHSLALKSISSDYKRNRDKCFSRLSAKQLAEILGIKKSWRIDKDHSLQAVSQAYLVQETVRRFAHSADEVISEIHVPRHGSLLAAGEPTLKAVNEYALTNAQHVWERMCDGRDPLPLGHDGYLKLWALSKPQLAVDYILLDEAQDTNPVVLDVLKRQQCQLVYVGDRYQQIYEWRGAVNAMEAIETDTTVHLTQSFRFGPGIADEASRILARLGELRPLTGNSALRSRVGICNPDAILARTNANVMTALIDCLEADRKPHLVGDNKDLKTLLRGVVDLKEGRPAEAPEFFGFTNWQAVVDFSKTTEGEQLAMFVNLVQSKGEKRLLWALNRSFDEGEADIVVSTAHKAKGREWRNVRLMDDFLKTREARSPAEQAAKEQHDAAELRLFYVAVTRAKEVIEIPTMRTGRREPERVAPPAPRAIPQLPKTSVVQPSDWKPAAKPIASLATPPPASKPAKRGFLARLFGG